MNHALRFHSCEFTRAHGGQNVPSWDGLRTSSALTELLTAALLTSGVTHASLRSSSVSAGGKRGSGLPALLPAVLD